MKAGKKMSELFKRYVIVRFYQNKPEKIIKQNVSLVEAQTHCKKESTHGPGWFDGYREIK
tara:strand:- start:44 stop:223 length:180 start_codon:yes stop_codon:yes gene_type:complete